MEHINNIEGLRHGTDNYASLEKTADYILNFLEDSGLIVTSKSLNFHEKEYRNIVADNGIQPDSDGYILLGAHYDASSGSPGADDNASGVAVMLETARVVGSLKINKPVRFVAFTLEEQQHNSISFLIGSRHFAEQAKLSGEKYDAVLILESVGFASSERGSQIIPAFAHIKAADIGNFLGVVSNSASSLIMKAFETAVSTNVPELPLYCYKAPFSGHLIPETRFSDHSPFWDSGYPAIMLTDTAMFRNPNYHTEHDTADTLDPLFMAKVTQAVISFIFTFPGSQGKS
jgi:Zn-dependent M28 family amino/carboxypeptidase